MEESVKTIIHVNQAVIRSNNRKELSEPVLTVKQGKKNTYAMKQKYLVLVKLSTALTNPFLAVQRFGSRQHQKLFYMAKKNGVM